MSGKPLGGLDVLNPRLTFGEVFSYARFVAWNAAVVLVALASFTKSETPFQTLTFVFLLIIYIKLVLLTEGIDFAASTLGSLLPQAVMRIRVLLHDEVSLDEQTHESTRRDESILALRQREVKLIIRLLFSGILFVIAAWNLVAAIL